MLRMRRRHTISRANARDSLKNETPLDIRPTKLHEVCAPANDNNNGNNNGNGNNNNNVKEALPHVSLNIIQRLGK